MPRIANAFAPRTQIGSDLNGLVSALFPGPNAALAAEELRARTEERRMHAAYQKAQMEKLAREATDAEVKRQEAALAQKNAPMAFVEGFAPGQGSDIMRFRQAGGMPTSAAVDVAPSIPNDDEGNAMPRESLPRPSRYDAGLEAVIAPFLAAMGAASANKSNVAQIGQAATGLGKEQARTSVMNGADPTRIAQSYYAVSGKAPFDETPSGVLDVSRGTVAPTPLSTAKVGEVSANTALRGAQTAKTSKETANILPPVEVTGPKGETFRVRGEDVSKGLVGQLFPPKAKPQFGWEDDPDNPGGLRPKPGGPADVKAQGVLNADKLQLDSTVSDMDRLATAANEVLNAPGLDGIFGLSGVVPNIPGSDAANAAAKLQTLKSQVGFGVLQNMRNASKTGGALGSISDKEHPLLQANLAALDKAQSADQARESLQQIIAYANRSKDRFRGAFNMKHVPNPIAPPPAAAAAQAAPGEPTATGPGNVKLVYRNGQWQPLNP